MSKRLRFHRPRHGRASRTALWWLAIPAALAVAALVLFLLWRFLPKTPADAPASSLPPEASVDSTPVADPDAWTAADPKWMLRLVNPWNSLPEGYAPALTELINGQKVDERCYPALQEMMDACRSAGNQPLICSSYRSWDTQARLFNADVELWKSQGYSQAEAEQKTAEAVAVPGTSEHQLGLAVDIVDLSYQLLEEGQENTATQKWLMENCWKYGFILRFPKDKTAITGIAYEPWHYRYVGQEAAEAITKAGLCLEEYLQQLS